MECYTLSRKQFEERCRFPLEIVPDWESHKNIHADMSCARYSGTSGAWRSSSRATPAGSSAVD